MPVMDGLTATKIIKSKYTDSIKILIVSNVDSQ